MRLLFKKRIPNIIIIGDYIIINVFFFINIFFYVDHSEYSTIQAHYKTVLFILNCSWYIITKLVKLYIDPYYEDSAQHFNSLLKALLLFIVFFFFNFNLIYSKTIDAWFCVKYLLFITTAMVVVRLVVFLIRKKYRTKVSRKLSSTNTVLIGKNNFSKTILSNEDIKISMGIRGFYSVEGKNEQGKYLGDLDCLFYDLEHRKIDNIILCDGSLQEEVYNNIVHLAEQKMIRIYIVPDFKYLNMGNHSMDVIQGVPFLKLMPEPLARSENQFIKRFFDIVFSLFVIIFILSWLIPLVGIIIKIESRGPIFFLQKRSGIKNEPFNCIKFRSMTVNSHADYLVAKKDDRRVTKFGRFMRKTSIDELPQFFNVLIGNMSVVGPRPHMLSQTEQYAKITKKYMLRHVVKPGITGWAQVMGSRGEIFSDKDMEKRIEKDIWYIQNWSFFLDLKIVFLTFYNIIKGDEQAY